MVTWFVAGRRHRRNFADEAEGRKEAALVATKLSAGEAQVLTLTSGDREGYLEAKRLLAPLCVPLHDAIKGYVAARTLLEEDALLPAVRYHRTMRTASYPEKMWKRFYRNFSRCEEPMGPACATCRMFAVSWADLPRLSTWTSGTWRRDRSTNEYAL